MVKYFTSRLIYFHKPFISCNKYYKYYIYNKSLNTHTHIHVYSMVQCMSCVVAVSGGEESVTTTPKSESSLTPRSRLLKRNERGETLLHTTCIRGDLKLVTSLIDQGADINTTDNAGM